MSKIGIIYKITNQLDGKIYIGQTIQSFKRRIQHHYASKDDMILHRAIRKYGKENFVAEEICSVVNKDDLNFLEKYFIQIFDSLASNGYNVALGGVNVMLGRNHSDETKQKMSESRKGREKNGNNIICNETGEIFISVSIAARKTGIYRKKIERQLTGEVKRSKIPLTFSYLNEIN